MLHLIPRLIPAPVHRVALRAAYRARHHWRRLRKPNIRGCQLVIEDFGGAILLLRHSYGPDEWALPGGGIARREQPEDAARREVLEELNMALNRVKPIGTISNQISGAPHTMHLFSAKTDQMPRPDQREVLEARFFPPHSLPEPLSDRTRECLNLWRERSAAP